MNANLARDLHTSHWNASSILMNIFGMRCVVGRFVQRVDFSNKKYREQTTLNRLDHATSESTFIKHITTGDKIQVAEFDIIRTENKKMTEIDKTTPKSVHSRGDTYCFFLNSG